MSLTLERARERARDLAVAAYDIHLDLTDESSYAVRTRVTFEAREGARESFIDLVGALEVRAVLNGTEVPQEAYAAGRLALSGLQPENELVVEARMPFTRSGDGMHEMTDPEDGHRYVGAYCGMDVASRVFPCFDQPDLKARINLTVDAPEEWTVVANGIATHDDPEDGVTRWSFTRTPPIATYLFVVCAGPWVSVRWEHAGLPMAWHARESQAPALLAQADDLRAVVEACLDYYERIFTEPYPFDSCESIFAPGLNWGALETPGCVTYHDSLLHPDGPTTSERDRRASVIAHELSHMWFGNLVTMRWWEDSWLNESFADHLGYAVADRVAGTSSIWADVSIGRKETGYRADVRRSTHRIAADPEEIPDVDAAYTYFDMITYAKGAAAVRQLITWLGVEDFLAGLNGHFAEHRFGNATLEDLIASLDRVTYRDVRGWAQAWLRTTGHDTLVVERVGAGSSDESITLSRKGSRTHACTVLGLDEHGHAVAEQVVEIGDSPIVLEGFEGLAVIPNADDETFARIELDDQTRAWVLEHLGEIGRPLCRALLWAHLIEEHRLGRLPTSELVGLVRDHLPGESHAALVERLLDTFSGAVLPQQLDSAEAKELAAALVEVGQRLRETGDRSVRTAATRVVLARGDESLVRHILENDWDAPQSERLDQEARWTAIIRLRELGAGMALVEHELHRDASARGRALSWTATAAGRDAEDRERAWAHLLDEGTSSTERQAVLAGLWRGGDELVGEWPQRYLDAIPTLVGDDNGLAGAMGKSCPAWPGSLDALTRWSDALAGAAARPGISPALARLWNDRLDDLDVRLARLTTRDGA